MSPELATLYIGHSGAIHRELIQELLVMEKTHCLGTRSTILRIEGEMNIFLLVLSETQDSFSYTSFHSSGINVGELTHN